MSNWGRDRRRRLSYPWFGIFEDFDRIEEMMEEMICQTFEEPSRKSRIYGPHIYGFSMSLGPDGKPIIREFGNVQPGRFGRQLREEREPLIDVMEEKEDISLHATEDQLTISVDNPNRRYHKEMPLPTRWITDPLGPPIKTGVLEVRLRKLEKKAEGEKIHVE